MKVRDRDAVRAALRAGYELEDEATAEVDAAACDEVEVLAVRPDGAGVGAEVAPPHRATLLTERPPRLFLGAPELTAAAAAPGPPTGAAAHHHRPPRVRVLGWEATADGAVAVRVEADEPIAARVSAGAWLRSVAWREFPYTVMEAARSAQYPLSRPVDDGVVALLEEARRPWCPENHHLFPPAARARARVVLRSLQYQRRLAGSARAGLDDLWLRILALAIDRRDD